MSGGWKLPVEYAINEDIHYDASVQEKFLVSTPTAVFTGPVAAFGPIRAFSA